MFCSTCGSNVDNAAVICPKCGVPTANYKKAATQATSDEHPPIGAGAMVGWVVLTLLIPIVGIIRGCVGLNRASQRGQGAFLLVIGVIMAIAYMSTMQL